MLLTHITHCNLDAIASLIQNISHQLKPSQHHRGYSGKLPLSFQTPVVIEDLPNLCGLTLETPATSRRSTPSRYAAGISSSGETSVVAHLKASRPRGLVSAIDDNALLP
jgi:hypothetical protein